MERMLGEGGMGMVVAATHLGLGTPVAIKFLHGQLAQNQQLLERFQREARASAQLRSEHVCRVSDVGMFDDGTPYIVMELLNGRDLSSILRANGPLPTPNAVELVLQGCVGIAEAHAAGIIHRDLKPANLFLTSRPDGTALVKVLDFGVAKTTQDGNFSLTQTSSVMGSPGYMSPEQLKSSRNVDARSDIWSLGVTIYELVIGRQPWNAESITELTLRIAMDPLPTLPPGTPNGLSQILAKCMEKDPAARFQNVAELAAALAPFTPAGPELAATCGRMLRGSTPVLHQGATLPSVSTPTTLQGASGVMTGTAKRRSWKLPAALAGVVVAGAVVAAIAVANSGSRAEPAASAPAAAPQPQPQPPPPPPTAPAAAPATVTAPAPAPTPTPTPSPKKHKPATAPTPKPHADDINDSRI